MGSKTLDFYRNLGKLQPNKAANKAERKLIRDIRIKRVEEILGVEIDDQTFIQKLEVFIAKHVNVGQPKYVGPGTDLKLYLQQGTLPKSRIDAAALKHDLAYVYASSFNNKVTRRHYVKKADVELLNQVNLVIEDPKSSEDEILEAGLVKRMISDIKGTIEHYFDLGFEGVSRKLKHPEVVHANIVEDLKQLNTLSPNNPQYKQLLVESSQIESPYLVNRELDIVTNSTDVNFEEKFNIIFPSEMDRRITQNNNNTPLKMSRNPYHQLPEVEERKSYNSQLPVRQPYNPYNPYNTQPYMAQPGTILNPGILEKPVIIDNATKALVEQNEAVARSQERIDIKPQIITGEKILRTFAVRDTGFSVIPTNDQVKQKQIWMAKFQRVAPGVGGLGNNNDTIAGQVDKPINNSIITAQRHNEQLRYSGNMFDGGCYVRPKHMPTESLMGKLRASLINSTPTYQNFIPSAAVGYTKPGKQIKMDNNCSNRFVTPTYYRNHNPLIFTQLVDGVPT